VYIDEWEWDDDNERELARHGLGPREVSDNRPRFRRNRHRRAATYMMIGPDRGGAIWVICIVENRNLPGRWRAVTGWLAEKAEKEWYIASS
jgi:hypothetical protein